MLHRANSQLPEKKCMISYITIWRMETHCVCLRNRKWRHCDYGANSSQLAQRSTNVTLSYYVWGQKAIEYIIEDNHKTTINGDSIVDATPNLFHALIKRIRSHDDFVDMLSTNQQESTPSSINSSRASRVLVWLGKDDENATFDMVCEVVE